MEIVRLTSGGESSVTIHHFGAHVTSWKNGSGREMIYTSPTAIYDGLKAIRGGVPICFPQFAKKGALRQHGFARNMKWAAGNPYTSPEGAAVKFMLSDTEETRATEWGYKFDVEYVVTLSPDGNKLSMVMTVKNVDSNSFSFTTALHSYYTCEAEQVCLSDYDGLTYEDNADETEAGKKKRQSGDITFGKEVDRVYLGSKDELLMPGMKIEKSNLPDAVVWNPYLEKAAALKDMPDEDWRKFICIEPARVAEPAVVQPGETWSCALVLTASS